MSVICPRCRTENPVDTGICYKCGSPLRNETMNRQGSEFNSNQMNQLQQGYPSPNIGVGKQTHVDIRIVIPACIGVVLILCFILFFFVFRKPGIVGTWSLYSKGDRVVNYSEEIRFDSDGQPFVDGIFSANYTCTDNVVNCVSSNGQMESSEYMIDEEGNLILYTRRGTPYKYKRVD